nr:MAG TPA: hypothetical protein [Bacteriophage sp.]
MYEFCTLTSEPKCGMIYLQKRGATDRSSVALFRIRVW